MLHKCANVACSVPFRRLSEGKLFQAETALSGSHPLQRSGTARKARKIEHFWLCNDCCTHLTLVFEKNHGVVAVPIPMQQPRHYPASVDTQMSRNIHWSEIHAVR